MRILGIDPGSRITGFGVVELSATRIQYVTSGCVRTQGADFAARLKEIFDGLSELIETHRPGEVAVERVFMHRNPDSALKLGQARGAALCAAMAHGARIYEYMPAEIKQAVVGRGGAAKVQVQHMVQVLLSLPGAPQADAADALAAAICHCHLRQSAQAAARAAGALK
ncbi:crossover junction endodeoxyribonuclease RuvC [Ectothiorhodospiraceae bacterium 2226]|nr:crossover junction endodeoxyribonuclease RuvC [Ectothiorhodospiraceae bacterium 2226]